MKEELQTPGSRAERFQRQTEDRLRYLTFPEVAPPPPTDEHRAAVIGLLSVEPDTTGLRLVTVNSPGESAASGPEAVGPENCLWDSAVGIAASSVDQGKRREAQILPIIIEAAVTSCITAEHKATLYQAILPLFANCKLSEYHQRHATWDKAPLFGEAFLHGKLPVTWRTLFRLAEAYGVKGLPQDCERPLEGPWLPSGLAMKLRITTACKTHAVASLTSQIRFYDASLGIWRLANEAIRNEFGPDAHRAFSLCPTPDESAQDHQTKMWMFPALPGPNGFVTTTCKGLQLVDNKVVEVEPWRCVATAPIPIDLSKVVDHEQVEVEAPTLLRLIRDTLVPLYCTEGVDPNVWVELYFQLLASVLWSPMSENAVFFIGPQRSGKSTLMRLAETTVAHDPEAVCDIGHDLEDRHALAGITPRTRVAALEEVGDVKGYLLPKMAKRVVGSANSTQTRRMHTDPGRVETSGLSLMGTGNEMPAACLRESAIAMMERTTIFPCENIRPVDKRESDLAVRFAKLGDPLNDELAALCCYVTHNWVAPLTSENPKWRLKVPPLAHIAALESVARLDTHPIAEFFRESIIFTGDPADVITVSRLKVMLLDATDMKYDGRQASTYLEQMGALKDRRSAGPRWKCIAERRSPPPPPMLPGVLFDDPTYLTGDEDVRPEDEARLTLGGKFVGCLLKLAPDKITHEAVTALLVERVLSTGTSKPRAEVLEQAEWAFSEARSLVAKWISKMPSALREDLFARHSEHAAEVAPLTDPCPANSLPGLRSLAWWAREYDHSITTAKAAVAEPF